MYGLFNLCITSGTLNIHCELLQSFRGELQHKLIQNDHFEGEGREIEGGGRLCNTPTGVGMCDVICIYSRTYIYIYIYMYI